jgi:hypothetical protein
MVGCQGSGGAAERVEPAFQPDAAVKAAVPSAMTAAIIVSSTSASPASTLPCAAQGITFRRHCILAAAAAAVLPKHVLAQLPGPVHRLFIVVSEATYKRRCWLAAITGWVIAGCTC